ncbi:MAG: hypothetical protein GY850_42900 [bacterium]|nr:hypothetical protein [bacterium]
MQLTSTLKSIHTLLTEAVADFQRHRNVNTLCEQLRNDLFALVETLLIPIIENVVCDPEFLPELKAGAGSMGLRFNGYRATSIRLLTGNPLNLQSPYFAKAKSKPRPGRKSKKRKRGTGRHFGLDYLGFISRCSTLLGSAVAQAALLCPSFEIAKTILKSHAIDLNVKTIHRITMDMGASAMVQRGRVSLCDTDCVDGKIVLICIDGGRLRERRAKRGRRSAGQKRQGYHAEWKEPIQIVIQTVNQDGTICKERLPLYDATMGDIDSAFDLLETYLRELNISTADRIVFCCDGARSYWKRTGPLAKKLGISKYHEVIDYTHAKQNLHEIIDKIPKKISTKEKIRITKMCKDLLWQGKLNELKKEIVKHIRYPKKRRQALAKFKSYFMKNRCRMQYDSFRNLKLPTGSGCVESAIRRVINLRLKSPGIFWKPETAESMLFLRSQLLSGRWNIMTENIFKAVRSRSSCH